MNRFEGQVAVVTGAAGGIGRAVAGAFARDGARVVLGDIDEAALDVATKELLADGYEALGVPTDVSSEQAIVDLRDRALERFGRVDVIHNNAGVLASGAVEDISLEAWRWVIDVDLWSVVYGVRAFVPVLKEQGHGHVVNTASTAGLQATKGVAPYNVAKFGVVGLSETLRVECEGTGVGVSVLCPGSVNTGIVHAERNRPRGVPASTGPIAERFTEGAGRILADQGIPPADVADLVLDAVATNRFWIITHPAWNDVILRRAEGMAVGDLVRDFGG